MAGILYYFPDHTEMSALEQMPTLAPHLSDVTTVEQIVHCKVLQSGPDGGQGVVVYPIPKSGDIPKLVKYDADGQIWTQCQRYWVGTYRDNPPQPCDLERHRLLPGYLVPDYSGQNWQIPVAKSPRQDGLPRVYTYDQEGNEISQVAREYEYLWEMAGEVYDEYTGERPLTENNRPRVMEVLAANYWVSKDVIRAFDAAGRSVLNDDFVALVLMSLIDGQLIDEYKKKEPSENCRQADDSLNSMRGIEGDCQPTAPVSAISNYH